DRATAVVAVDGHHECVARRRRLARLARRDREPSLPRAQYGPADLFTADRAGFAREIIVVSQAEGGSPWGHPPPGAGVVASPPNQQLLEYAAAERTRRGANRCLDLGCGAARNAEALVEIGYELTGIDLSLPMLRAAAGRVAKLPERARLQLVHSAMTPLPF